MVGLNSDFYPFLCSNPLIVHRVVIDTMYAMFLCNERHWTVINIGSLTSDKSVLVSAKQPSQSTLVSAPSPPFGKNSGPLVKDLVAKDAARTMYSS